MYSKKTRKINITVNPYFLDDQSEPDEQHFVWAYQVTIDNQGNAFFNVGYSFHSESEVDDVSFIEMLVLDLQDEFELNPKRAFATGMSNGGDMRYLLACKKSTLFSFSVTMTICGVSSFFTSC